MRFSLYVLFLAAIISTVACKKDDSPVCDDTATEITTDIVGVYVGQLTNNNTNVSVGSYSVSVTRECNDWVLIKGTSGDLSKEFFQQLTKPDDQKIISEDGSVFFTINTNPFSILYNKDGENFNGSKQ